MPTTHEQALEIYRRYSGKVNRTICTNCSTDISPLLWDLFSATVISRDVLQKFTSCEVIKVSDLMYEVMTAIEQDPEKLGKFISVLEELKLPVAQEMKKDWQSE